MSKKPTPMTKEARRDAALKTAVQFAKKSGARRVSIASVAAKQGVTAPLLFHIFESHAAFVKAIEKRAKQDGVVLPVSAPTVREQRAANLKASGKKPAIKLAPPKPKKVAVKLAPPKKPEKLSKVITRAMKPLPRPAVKLAPPKPTSRKPLTPAQKAKKAARDKARRAPAVVMTPAEKFASLPRPFEAAMKQVAA